MAEATQAAKVACEWAGKLRLYLFYEQVANHVQPRNMSKTKIEAEWSAEAAALLRCIIGNPFRPVGADRARFVGTLEASVGVGAPNWWSNSLLRHTVRRGFSVDEPFRYQQLTKQMKVRSNATETWTDAGLGYSTSNNHYLIPRSTWVDLGSKSDYSYTQSSLSDDSDSIYVVMHAEPGVQPVIGRIDKNTMRLRWSQMGWASGIYHPFGPSEHYISPEQSHRSVVLYGLTPSGIFVEQFSKATGQPMMRYSSESWNVDPKRK
jgi:hypothetical protein